jgi:hypothetical protein
MAMTVLLQSYNAMLLLSAMPLNSLQIYTVSCNTLAFRRLTNELMSAITV